MKKILICCFCLWTSIAFAQKKYFVYLKDKNNNGYALTDAQKFLSERALLRRQKQKLSINNQDMPLTEAYVKQIQGTGAKILGQSRWFNAVLVECDEVTYNKINSLAFVKNGRTVSMAASNEEPLLERPKIQVIDTENLRTEGEN